MSAPAWLEPTLAVLRGQIPDKTGLVVGGTPGKTHCGRCWSVPWRQRQRYGFLCRLVCVLEPGHDGEHKNRDGWWWAETRTPSKRRRQ